MKPLQTLLVLPSHELVAVKNATWKSLLVNMSESSEVAKNIFRTLANVMNPQVNWEFTIVELCLNKKIIYEGTKQVFKKIRDATTNIQGLKKDKKFIITVANSFLFYEASELHHLSHCLKITQNVAFPTNFCPIRIDLSGNTVWPQALSAQNLVKMDHFLAFLINFCPF